MKEGKNFKLWTARSDLIGDQIMSLPILTWLEKQYPNSYKFFSVLRKCSQAAPLYFNHPLIDKVIISDFNEGFGETDKFYYNQCDIKLNTRPQHPFEQDWYNYRNIYEETWVMAGLPIQEFYKLTEEEKKPKLYPWFNIDIKQNTICYHAFAGYGDKEGNRSPNKKWSENFINDVIKLGFNVIRIGFTNEPIFNINNIEKYKDVRDLSFIDQVKLALSCNLYIGTDSGFSLVISAYDLVPQITLISNLTFRGHVTNFFALAPNGNKNINCFAKNGCSNIKIEDVLSEIKNLDIIK